VKRRASKADSTRSSWVLDPRLCSLRPSPDARPTAYITKNLAQKIAGKNRGDHLKGRHWQRLARECGLGAPQVMERVRALAQAAAAQADTAAADVAAMPGGSHAMLDHTKTAVGTPARALCSLNWMTQKRSRTLKAKELESKTPLPWVIVKSPRH
jgi:hypothetical protein